MFSKPSVIDSLTIIHIHDHYTSRRPFEANLEYVLDVKYKNGDIRREFLQGHIAERTYGKPNVKKATREYWNTHPQIITYEESKHTLDTLKAEFQSKQLNVTNGR